MILQAVLFLLAASVLQAPAPEPTKTSVLPPDCGLTEEQILSAVIPDYEPKVARFRNDGANDRSDYRFEPRVNAAVETDFGWPDKHLLVVTADSSVGHCEGCHDQVVAVIDLLTKKVLWREERAGTPQGSPVRFFLDGPGLPAFSIQEYSASTSWGEETSEVMFGPRFGPKGTLECDVLWKGLIDFAVQGNQPGGGFGGCGQLRGPDESGNFTYERRTFLGQPREEFAGQDGTTNPLRNQAASSPELPPCFVAGLQESGAVEIRHTEKWRPKADVHALTRESALAQRVDHAPTDDFPFNLRMRDQKFLTGVTKVGVCRAADGERSVPSPDAKLTAVTNSDRCYSSCRLRLLGRGQDVRRIIELGQYVGGAPVAIGWSADSKRVYAVVGFGEDDGALLSFSVDGKDDYWEELLAGIQKGWEDGFVVSPRFHSWTDVVPPDQP